MPKQQNPKLLNLAFLKKTTALVSSLSLTLMPVVQATALTDGEDVLYAVKSTSGSTQDWGTIAPSTGTFTSIAEISPTGLGWPLGDIGSESDPINGYVYTRQTNTAAGGATDVLTIKKSDGSTKWLGIGANSIVVGYDTKDNKLIYRESAGSTNTLKKYDNDTSTTSTIGTFGGSSTSWQAGGIGAVDSYGRTAFQLRPDTTSTLYKIDLDDGTETTVSISQYVTTIAWDSKEQKLYGLYDSNSNGAYRVAEINTSDGSLTNVGAADTVAGMSNYVQLIAPNDQRYYVQESPSDIRAISLTDGSSLGTFDAPLRLMPPGAVVLGAASTDETVSFDIDAPDSKIIKLGANDVTYTGTNNSTNGVDIEAGTLKVASSVNLGSGAVSLEGGELELSADATVTNDIASTNDTSAIDTGEQSVTISGDLSGTGEINKVGDGTLTLTGSLNNSGGVDVTAGTLVANGTGTTPVTVTSGVLQGSGTIGNLTSNSTIEPGNSIGTLNVSGAVTLGANSVLVIEIDAAGNNDKIIATGAVTTGGTLRVSPASGTYSTGQQYTIITGSSVSGTFSNITVLSCSGSASAAYGATSVTITFSGCSVNLPKNQETVTNYINDISAGASGDLSTVITALNTLSGDAYNSALDSLDYNTAGAVSSVGQQQMSSINNVISQRVSSTGSGDKTAQMIGFMTHPSLAESSAVMSFSEMLQNMSYGGGWVRAVGGSGEKKKLKTLGVNGYDYNFSGLTFGFDKDTDSGVEGVAFSLQSASIDSANSEGKTDNTSVAISKYKSQTLENGNRLNLTGTLLLANVESKRYLNFSTIDRTATGKYTSYGLDLNAEYSYSAKQLWGASHNVKFLGGVSVNHQPEFTETGASSLNLKVNSNTSTVGRLGVSDTMYWGEKDATGFIPFTSLGIHVAQNMSSTQTKQEFVNQSSFTTKSDRKTNTYGEIGFGFLNTTDKGSEVSFVTNGKFSDKVTEYSAALQMKYKF